MLNRTLNLRSILLRGSFCAALAIASFSGTALAGGDQASPTPRTATVSGSSVRLRGGPSTSHGVVAVVKQGDALIVTGQKVSWLKVRVPADAPCWISEQFVTIEGKTAKVTADRVNLRLSPNTAHFPIGQVSNETLTLALSDKGDVQKQNGYVKVVAPESAAAWIADEFVKLGAELPKEAIAAATTKQGEIVVVPTGPVDDERSKQQILKDEFTTFDELDKEFKKELLKPEEERNFSQMKALYEHFSTYSNSEILRTKAAERVGVITKFEGVVVQAKEADAAATQARKAAEDAARERYERIRNAVEEVLPKKQDPTTVNWLVKGYITDHDKNAMMPATHAISDANGAILFYVRWEKGDLNDYWQDFVGITGVQKTYDGWNKPVIVIDKCVKLPAENLKDQ